MGSIRTTTEIAFVLLCTLTVLISSPSPSLGGERLADELCAAQQDAELASLLALEPVERFDFAESLGQARWRSLAPAIEDGFLSATPGSAERAQLLDLLALAPTELARKLGREFWNLDAPSFDPDHCMAFAVHGLWECEVALASYVAVGRRTLYLANIGPAVFLALRGDPAGRAILQRAWDWTDLKQAGAGRALLVAFALEQLDGDGALGEMRLLVAQGIRAAEAGGDADLARRLRQESEAFDRLIDPRTGEIECSELAWFGEKLGRHCQERGTERKCPEMALGSDPERQSDVRALSLPRGAWPI